MTHVPEIVTNRSRVVDAAKHAVAQTRAEGHEVSTKLVRKLMKVARTAPEFALNVWYIDERCGCLVGNLLGPEQMRDWLNGEFVVEGVPEFVEDDDELYALGRLGIYFNEYWDRDAAGHNDSVVLRVIE